MPKDMDVYYAQAMLAYLPRPKIEGFSYKKSLSPRPFKSGIDGIQGEGTEQAINGFRFLHLEGRKAGEPDNYPGETGQALFGAFREQYNKNHPKHPLSEDPRDPKVKAVLDEFIHDYNHDLTAAKAKYNAAVAANQQGANQTDIMGAICHGTNIASEFAVGPAGMATGGVAGFSCSVHYGEPFPVPIVRGVLGAGVGVAGPAGKFINPAVGAALTVGVAAHNGQKLSPANIMPTVTPGVPYADIPREAAYLAGDLTGKGHRLGDQIPTPGSLIQGATRQMMQPQQAQNPHHQSAPVQQGQKASHPTHPSRTPDTLTQSMIDRQK